MVVGKPLDTLVDPPGPAHARELQDRLECANEFPRNQLLSAGARQRWNYDVHTSGSHLTRGGEGVVWVYSPQWKKGRCQKLGKDFVCPLKWVDSVSV